MLDSKIGTFVQELQRCGLVKLAESQCATWQDGMIAQDPSGDVYAFNAEVEPRRYGWSWATPVPYQEAYRLAKLAESGAWRDHFLPMRAVLRPHPEWGMEQQAFFQTLLNEGVIKKTALFLSRWKRNVWLAMDPNGDVFLYNSRPRKAAHVWVRDEDDMSLFHRLGTLSAHQMDWGNCRVKLNDLLPAQPTITLSLNNPERADCWI